MNSLRDGYERAACNLCGGNRKRVVFGGLGEAPRGAGTYRSSSTDVGGERVVRCRDCGLAFVDPRPSFALVRGGYADAVDESYVSQARGRIRAFRRLARRLVATGGRGRLLDVGAAAGFFCVAARQAGFEVEGIEPSRWMSRLAASEYGVTIHTMDLGDAPLAAQSFDVVTFLDVLEHLHDPAAALAEARRLLKPGGMVAISFPDFGSIWARLFGRRWWFVLSVHLYYFTRRTIAMLLARSGFAAPRFSPYLPALEIGYLLGRLEVHSPRLGGLLGELGRRVGAARWTVPYYAAQSLALARPRDRAPVR